MVANLFALPAPVPEPFNPNSSKETLLPPYASTTTLSNPTVFSTEAASVLTVPAVPAIPAIPAVPAVPAVATIASVPLEKVSEAVVAYFGGEEGRSMLRTTIGEEVEKQIEKRNLAASVANLTSPPQTSQDKPKTREVAVKQVYAVYCNICTGNVDSIHYHCGICDGGDFDLCENCVSSGKHCEDAEHWMIKRTIVDGEVISSREVIASNTAIVSKKAEMLNRKEEEKPEEEEPQDVAGRTCNCCCEGNIERTYTKFERF